MDEVKEISPPPDDHKLYLVASVALATVSFFLNSIQIVALVKHVDLLTNVQNVLMLSQSITGLLTTFTVIYPIKLVTGSHPRHWHDPTQPDSLSDLATCLTLASGLYLLSIFLAVTNSTLITAEQYLAVVHPHSHLIFREDHVSLAACITVAWIETTIFTLIPWLGWNEWRGQCLLPDLWTLEFAILFTVVVGAHLLSESLMVTRLWLFRRRKAYAINPEGTAAASFGGGGRPHSHVTEDDVEQRMFTSIGLATASSLTTLVCHVPLFVHWMAYAGCAEDDSSRTDAFIWTSLLLLVNAIAKPMFHVFGDDQLSKTLLDVLRSFYSC